MSEGSWRKRRTAALLSAAAVAALVAAGCGSSDDNSTSTGGGSTAASTGSSTAAAPKGGGTINVGNITSVAGIGGVFAAYQAGVKAYFDQANAAGGINGTKVNLTALDDAGDPAKAAGAARQLVGKKVVAIVGMASLADAAVQKYLQAQGIPLVGGWATSPAWHKPSTNMFNNIEGPNSPYCPLWSADAAKEDGIKSIASIAQDFPVAIDDGNCRLKATEHVGLKVAGKRIDVSLTATDYRPVMQKAIATGADAIYFSTGADGIIKGVQAGEQLGFKGTYIAPNPAGLVAGLKNESSAISGRMISAAFSLLPTDDTSKAPALGKWKEAMSQYQPKYQPDLTSISGYAAAYMFADALKAVGPDSKKITDWLASQTNYTFGGLQGKVDYTDGSKPNLCTTRLLYQNGTFVRDKSAAPAPQFNCGILINTKTGEQNGG